MARTHKPETAAKRAHSAKSVPKTTRSHSSAATKQLELLARALKGKSPQFAYSRLSAIADAKSSGVDGTRA
ncbi:MAG TPA: hypothetical protein VN727_06535, partial [Candidatus Binatia bacterium]|nr:hypothetical protein [Candidatus Binatia bacterium]